MRGPNPLPIPPPHAQRAPRVGGRDGFKVGVGVGGLVRKTTMLREGHCLEKKNMHEGPNLKKIVHIGAIFAQMGILCEGE